MILRRLELREPKLPFLGAGGTMPDVSMFKGVELRKIIFIPGKSGSKR